MDTNSGCQNSSVQLYSELQNSLGLFHWLIWARIHRKEGKIYSKVLHIFSYIQICYACMHAKSLQSCLTLQPYEEQPTRLFCPWDAPSKNSGMDCHALLQGIFLTQGIESASLVSPALEGRFFTTSTTWEASNMHVPSSKSWFCQAYTENLISLYIKHVSSE